MLLFLLWVSGDKKFGLIVLDFCSKVAAEGVSAKTSSSGLFYSLCYLQSSSQMKHFQRFMTNKLIIIRESEALSLVFHLEMWSSTQTCKEHRESIQVMIKTCKSCYCFRRCYASCITICFNCLYVYDNII